MKTIDAVWEKRNLGVETVEFKIDYSDDESVMTDILNAEKQYNVVKLPVNKPELMALLQDNGYRFVECMLSIQHDLSDMKKAAAQHLRMFHLDYFPMDKPDIEVLFLEMKTGMFSTDRIYNDPLFSKEKASDRYKNWINDELERGAVIYKLVFRDTAVGFFILKKLDGDILNPFLVGLYDGYQDKGFGLSLAFNILTECQRLGARKIVGSVSSNNPAIVRLDEMLGYEIRDIEYVFVKHRMG